MLRALIYLGLTASAIASESLDVLVNAAASFSATLQQQVEVLQSNPSPAQLAEKTIDYAEAKEAYFRALGTVAPEILKIATGKGGNSLELDTFAAAFAIADDERKSAADQETIAFLQRYRKNPKIEKARAEFERAQRAEEHFHKGFPGLELTN